MRDRLWLMWQWVTWAVLTRFGRRTLELSPYESERGADPAGSSSNGPTRLDSSKHTSRVFDAPGQHEGDEERFDVECDLCGWIAAGDSVDEAEAIARLHEQFVAVLVDQWEVPE